MVHSRRSVSLPDTMDHRAPSVAAARAPEPHVFVGVSGGVDSAVAGLLLQRQGLRVSALFMKNWEEDDADGRCAAAEDLDSAEHACDRLGIELFTVNLSSEYWDGVFTRFLAEHRAGRTPNPDVLCNREVKFDAFVEHAKSLGADRIATGHYARIVERGSRRVLLRGLDPGKDQSYFLHLLDQRKLAHSLFPLGHLDKTAVRRIAREAGLALWDRKDSTGICFVGERPFRGFLSRFLASDPGPIESVDGTCLGTHQGLAFHTIGQRRGLRIGGRPNGRDEPWYVARKDTDRNALVVAQGHDHPALLAPELRGAPAHWIAGTAPRLPLRCTAQIRYRQSGQACEVHEGEGGGVRVCFDQPQWAVAPGQSVVFYRGQECLGGAVIESTRSPGAA
jgi:tRNA-specific 2-thiouridylase